MLQYAKGTKITGLGDTAYEGDVKKLLDLQIGRNDVGKVVLDAIAAANDAKSKAITILPYTENHDKKTGLGHCNASTERLDEPGASESGHPYYEGEIDDDPKKRYRVSDKNGTGAGSDAVIHFTPGKYGPKSECSNGFFGGLADEVLFHEMVHGLRDIQGKRDAFPTDGSVRGYENNEEYLAIMVANIYLSVKGSTQLRGSFDASVKLAADLSTSEGFLTDNDNVWMMVWLYDQDKTLFDNLRMVAAKFNPVRELVPNITKYRDRIRPKKR